MAEGVWVHESGQDLRGFDETWSRAIEVGVAVDRVHAPPKNGRKRLPARLGDEIRDLPPRLREAEAAGHRTEHLGGTRLEGAPLEPRAVRTGRREKRFRTGGRREFRHPVAGHHEGIEPLDAGEARA